MFSVDFRNLPTWGMSLVRVENVDEVVKKQLQEVPERYIRSDEERPTSPTTLCDHQVDIPVIDMAKIAHPQHRQQEISRIAEACQDWGFFQVVNHGIPQSLIDRVKRVGKEFFQLPPAVKQRYAVRSGDLQGYGQTFVVSEHQKLDWGNLLGLIISPTELKNLKIWPTEIVAFRESVEAYNSETRRLAETLLALIAETLQLPSDFFENKFGNVYQKMRMNYYPPCIRPDLVLGLSAHADMTGLTLLLQDDEAAGLQIHKNGEWTFVQPIPYALVINIGNLIEVMTNGRYKSIEHRAVTNKDKGRLSIAVFVAPGFNEEIAPADQLVDETHPCLFRKFIHGDYIKHYFSRKVEGKNSLYDYAASGTPIKVLV